MLLPSLLIGPKYVPAVLSALQNAQRSIEIIMFEWRFYPKHLEHPVTLITEALKSAVSRGVEVRVLMAHDGSCYELTRMGIKSKRIYRTGLVHAKVMCIDRSVCVLGSHNYTQAAFTRNLEISLMVESSDIAAAFSEYFNALWGV